MAVVPSAVGADGLAAFGATLRFINISRFSTLPFEVGAGYRRLVLDDADDHDRISLNDKVKVLDRTTVRGRTTTLSMFGGFERTLGLKNDFEATAALEQGIDTSGAWAVGIAAS